MKRIKRAPWALSVVLCLGCTGNLDGAGTPQLGASGAAAGGGAATGGAGMVGSGGAMSFAALSPAPAVMARLTQAQYRNVVRDLFGVTFTERELELDTRPYNFSVIGASESHVSERGVSLYQVSAHDIASHAFSEPAVRARLVPCLGTALPDSACLGKFVADFGLRAFRRPLKDAEVQRYVALGVATGMGEPWLGPQEIASAMLQSPHFLYRVELGETAPEHPTWSRYTAYEMASRLSFLLRNSLPDGALLDAAASNRLSTAEGVRSEAERLLADAAPTHTMVDQLFREYLDIPLLAAVNFPADAGMPGSLAVSLGNEVSSLVNRIALDDRGDMRTLFTSRNTVVDAPLAALYGLAAPAAGTSAAVELPIDGPRAGLLTTGAMLALHNRLNRTAPTLRGSFVRQRLLCGTVPPPPDNIPPFPEVDMGAPTTVRAKVEAHATNPTCNACHRLMDPIGLGLEEFDQYGRFRTEYENGLPVDNTGDLDGAPFKGARQLGELLAKDERVSACLVKQMYRYASARLDDGGEEGLLAELSSSFAASGYQFQPLMLALVQSDGFRYFKPEAP